MNLFQVLSKGERVIVASNEENTEFITWNRSNTFQWWSQRSMWADSVGHHVDSFVEVDIKTYQGCCDASGCPRGSKTLDFQKAETIAKNWLFHDGSAFPT